MTRRRRFGQLFTGAAARQPRPRHRCAGGGQQPPIRSPSTRQIICGRSQAPHPRPARPPDSRLFACQSVGITYQPEHAGDSHTIHGTHCNGHGHAIRADWLQGIHAFVESRFGFAIWRTVAPCAAGVGPLYHCYNRFVRWRRAGVWSRISCAHQRALRLTSRWRTLHPANLVGVLEKNAHARI